MLDSGGYCGRENDVPALGFVCPEVVVYCYIDGLCRRAVQEGYGFGSDLLIEGEKAGGYGLREEDMCL